MEIGNFPPVWRIVTRKNEPRPKILARPGQGTNTFFGGTMAQLLLFNHLAKKKILNWLCVWVPQWGLTSASPAFGGNLWIIFQSTQDHRRLILSTIGSCAVAFKAKHTKLSLFRSNTRWQDATSKQCPLVMFKWKLPIFFRPPRHKTRKILSVSVTLLATATQIGYFFLSVLEGLGSIMRVKLLILSVFLAKLGDFGWESESLSGDADLVEQDLIPGQSAASVLQSVTVLQCVAECYSVTVCYRVLQPECCQCYTDSYPPDYFYPENGKFKIWEHCCLQTGTNHHFKQFLQNINVVDLAKTALNIRKGQNVINFGSQQISISILYCWYYSEHIVELFFTWGLNFPCRTRNPEHLDQPLFFL